MRKVLFLMFLLLLMGLGAAGVKAQVRIGGNTAPSAAAVLDLNASDAANFAPGGLVLPRVDLKTNVMQLTPGVPNQVGTMVYNVTTTLGRIGIFFWNGNTWVLANLPSTSPADSGKVLAVDNLGHLNVLNDWAVRLTITATAGPTSATTFTRYDLTFTTPAVSPFVRYWISAPGVLADDICVFYGGNPSIAVAYTDNLLLIPLFSATSQTMLFRCFRGS